MKSAEPPKLHLLSDNQRVALDAPLPKFPDIAWRGIFESYRELMAVDPLAPETPISECPMPFHFANFLSVLAAELGDRVRLAEGTLTVPNFYIFCCGRTGTKKSTASDLVEEAIVKNFPETPDHMSLTQVSSAEGLIRTLMQHPNLLLRYDEVKDLFATAGRSGQRIEPVLNAAYNLRRIQGIVKSTRDSISASDYYFNLFVNGTPEHVLLDLSEAFFKGGLLNRFLVFAAKPTGVVKPEMGTPDAAIAREIAKRVLDQCIAWRLIAPARGDVRVTMEPEARVMHEAWYTQHTLAQQERSDLEAAPHTRLDVFAKKIGMVYALYEAAPNKAPMISSAQMHAAISVVEYCQECMNWMVEAWSGQQTIQQRSEVLMEQRIEAFMRKRHCCEEREMYHRLRLSFGQAARVVNALVAAGTLNVTGERPRWVHYRVLCECDT